MMASKKSVAATTILVCRNCKYRSEDGTVVVLPRDRLRRAPSRVKVYADTSSIPSFTREGGTSKDCPSYTLFCGGDSCRCSLAPRKYGF